MTRLLLLTLALAACHGADESEDTSSDAGSADTAVPVLVSSWTVDVVDCPLTPYSSHYDQVEVLPADPAYVQVRGCFVHDEAHAGVDDETWCSTDVGAYLTEDLVVIVPDSRCDEYDSFEVAYSL